jgi:predicted nucleic acid-binding protein
MYLLDTAIVFELRAAKAGRTDAGLAAWAAGIAREDMFISALALLELEDEAARTERKDKAAGAALRAWIGDQVMRAFEGRILAVDAAVVRRRALLPYPDARDGLLAATALEHGLTLVTRNIAAFKAGRVRTFDPWGHMPASSEEDADWRQAARTSSLWLKNLFVRT